MSRSGIDDPARQKKLVDLLLGLLDDARARGDQDRRGVAVDAEYEQQVRRTIAARAEARARWRAAKLAAKATPPEIEWPDDWPAEWILTDDALEAAVTDECPF